MATKETHVYSTDLSVYRLHYHIKPRQNGRYLPENILKGIFLIEKELILPKISLKFVSKVRIYNIPALVQIMAWCRSGDKPISGPMTVSSVTHLCVARPQWVMAVA